MGRQTKIGLDYFLFDVGLLDDPKLRGPRQQYGYLAQVVYIALLSILYGDKGYYIDYRKNKKNDVLWQVHEKISGRYTTSMETIASVITCLTECELFSGEQFQAGIITSARAQKNYYAATAERKNPSVNFDYWLLSENDMRAISTKSIVLHKFISRPKNEINQPINKENRSENTQSREEKSRVEKSIAENSRADMCDLLADIETILEETLDDMFRLELQRMRQSGMQNEVFLSAAEKTVQKAPKNRVGYFRAILDRYERDGVLTAADLSVRADQTKNISPRQQEPVGELLDWEKQWLREMGR